MSAPTEDEVRGAVSLINNEDLGMLFHLLTSEERKSSQDLGGSEAVIQAIRGYRQFLTLCYLFPDMSLRVTNSVDIVWETHMTCSIAYMDMCERLFGCYLHHSPFLSPDPAETNWAIEFVFGAWSGGETIGHRDHCCGPPRGADLSKAMQGDVPSFDLNPGLLDLDFSG